MDFPKTYKNTKSGKYNWQYCWTVRIFSDYVEISFSKFNESEIPFEELINLLSARNRELEKLNKKEYELRYLIENINPSFSERIPPFKMKNKQYIL